LRTTSYQDGYDPRSPSGGRTTTATVLREAMQALGRVQAYMLARIVVEILHHRQHGARGCSNTSKQT
jgi:hypothetical protein